ETADGGETTSEVVFEDRRIGTRHAELGDQTGCVSARAVGPLANEEVLCPLKIAPRKAEFAERLLERTGDEMALRRRERNIARVVCQRHTAAVDVVVALHRIQLRHVFDAQIEDINVFQT